MRGIDHLVLAVADLAAAQTAVERASVDTAKGDGRLSVLRDEAFGTVLAFAGT